MKGVVQLNPNGPPNGDCHRACVASLLGVPTEAVPNFIDYKVWWDELNRWLVENHGLYLLHFEAKGFDWEHAGYLIASGPSPRGDFKHSVVYYKGEMVHDPHPSGVGLAEPPTNFDVLIPVDPAAQLRRGISRVISCGRRVRGAPGGAMK